MGRVVKGEDLVSVELTVRSGPVHSNNKPKVLALETGPPTAVPSRNLLDVFDQALKAAAYVAGDQMVTEVRLLVYPADLLAQQMAATAALEN
jgi:hypothetical protein